MLKIYLTINFSLGHYSSCLELHLKFVSFLCDPCLYPFPYMMSTFNHCACATPAFSPPVSSLEPAFQKKEIHKPFIHSFIPFLPPSCLQTEQEVICAWWLTIRFCEGIMLNITDSHTFGFVRSQCLGKHSPVNTIQGPCCWSQEL